MMVTLKIKRFFFFGEHDAEPWHGMRFKISEKPISSGEPHPGGGKIIENPLSIHLFELFFLDDLDGIFQPSSGFVRERLLLQRRRSAASGGEAECAEWCPGAAAAIG
jgi:hypothetical protein